MKAKLHFCTDIPIQYRYKKIKSVITALGIDVIDVPRQTFADLRQLSPIPTLPLLQTSEGNFTSSNTIIRYLASKAGNKLYGGQSLYERALIDQWLDLTQIDFDTCSIALNVYLDGKQVDIESVRTDAEKFLTHLNKHLKNKKFIVGNELTIADLAVAATISPVISNLYGEQERKKYGIIANWFHSIGQLNKEIQPKQLPKKIHKKFEKKKDKTQENKDQKGKNKQKNKQQEKKEKEDGKQKKKKEKGEGKEEKKDKKDKKDNNKKEQKVEQKKQEDDLFGDTPPTDQKKQAPKPAPKKQQKKKPAAKSIVVFNVKVFEFEQDLTALAEKIKTTIKVDGLVWNQEVNIVPIAFGMNMLELGCVIEDDKVSIEEDVYNVLYSWENEIQSIDTVNFQKL